MPNAEVHRKLHIKWAPVAMTAGMLTAYAWGGTYAAWFAALGYALERWFSPDLDHKGFTAHEIEIRKIPLIGPYFLGHSGAYAQIIAYLPRMFGFPKGHNSFWSHFPPVGALTVLGWFWWPFLLLFRYFFLDDLTVEFWGIYCGLHMAFWVHSLADLMDSKRNIGIVRFFKRK